MQLNDADFIRYQRQVQLSEVGEQGQLRLKHSRVLIIGMGGLGSAVSMYLAGAGVGHLVIADGDIVELSNLPRQILYQDKHCQSSKATIAAQQLLAMNPTVCVRAVAQYLEDLQLSLEVSMADVVVDCSDNMQTRQQVNVACVEHQKVLISAAVTGWQGQCMRFDFRQNTTPCYRCLFPFEEIEEGNDCQQGGVLAPVVGVIGTVQALDVLKHLLNLETNASLFSHWNALNDHWQHLTMAKDPNCCVCHTEFKEDKHA